MKVARRLICISLFSLFALLPTTTFGQSSSEEVPEVLWHVELLSKQEAADQIVGSVDDPFFSKLYPREVATMTGTPRGTRTTAESRAFARSFFRNATLDFIETEAQALREIVELLDHQFGDRYPRLIRRRWKFIKTRADLCGGFSFTRGDCIVLSAPTVQRVVDSTSDAVAVKRSEELLLHEQMHVLQRETPDLFRSLYEDVCGFRKAHVVVNSWFDERQISNPDGVDDHWVIDVTSTTDSQRTYWIGTLLKGDKRLHRMGRDFRTVAVQLQSNAEGYVMSDQDDVRPEFTSLAEMPAITTRLPLPPIYDHVNEVGAYLLTSITHNRPGHSGQLSVRAAEVLVQARVWFAKHLARSVDE